MTEHENEPQRPPAPADAEPSQPTAELPRPERGESGSVPSQSGVPGQPSGDAAPHPTGPAPSNTGQQPGAGQPYAAGQQPGPGQPYAGGQPYAAGQQPGAGQPYPAGQPYGRPAGYPASAGYPGGPYQQTQGHPHSPWQQPTQHAHQPGWPGAPGYQQGPAGAPQHQTYPGGEQRQAYPGGEQQQTYPGGEQAPVWAQGPGAAGPGQRPSRAGRYVAAGVVALALMAGSGIAGGVVALAVNHGGPTVTRTYSAAPVINQNDLPKIAQKVQNSVVSITTENGEGSGVVLSGDGYILTNNHVVASATGPTVKVIFADGKNATARIVGTDPKSDLAVIKASDVSDLAAATFGDSDAMQVGDTVLALGSPLGLEGSVTAGIISAKDRTIQASDQNEQQQDPFQQQRQQGGQSISGLLQTDAPINPGNSGGALVNTKGEVIGINSAIATAGQSNGNIGVGFAIPSNKAKAVAEALRAGKKVSHPSLGVSVASAENGGALVNSVVPGSPAEKAGLQQGDVITKFGDSAIRDSNALVAAVQSGKVGDQVQLSYTRNGAQKTATVTLAESS